MVDDAALCGAVCVWLAREKREWVSGRFISSNWDMDELADMKDDIVQEDKLKWKMAV